MDGAERKAKLEAVLARAGEVLGDITPHVYRRYYAREPEAREVFAYNYPGGQSILEGRMVEQTLFCLMEWLDRRGEIEMVLVWTIPHHLDTLGVNLRQFTQLVSAVVEVITETIPDDRPDEAEVWNGIITEITDVMAEAATYADSCRPALSQGQAAGKSRLASP